MHRHMRASNSVYAGGNVRHILLASQDEESCASLCDYLLSYNLVLESANCDTILRKSRTGFYETIILDTPMPPKDGLSLLAELRRASDVYVLTLIPEGDKLTGVVALEIGADDYLEKPFEPRELLARILAGQRRRSIKTIRDCLREDEISVDPGLRCAWFRDQTIDLTTMEFTLLENLVRSAGEAVSRESLTQSVLGRHFDPFDRSLDMLVSRLRKKLQAAGAIDRIKTIRSLGYQFAVSLDPRSNLRS